MIYILGAGGFGREVLCLYHDLGRAQDVAGFLEEHCQQPGRLINEKPVQDVSVLEQLDRASTRLICAIGTPLRKRLIETTRSMGYQYETLVHPSVIRSQWVTLGHGAILCAGTILTCQVVVADHAIINLDCTIGHDVTIGKYTTLSPGVHVSGRVSIGDECFIGTGVSIVDKVRIGERSYIGAGAVVTRDIPPNVLAVGIPAKPVRLLLAEEWLDLV
jgi:sugar O-acyltransferase (sialic acid O-acetyltransferase NeuD family)